VVLVIFFTVLVLAGCSPALEPMDTSPNRRVVEVAQVQPAHPASRAILPGRVAPSQKTTLSFEVAGQVAHLTLDVGDAFQRGDTLARLDKARYQLVYERSQAAEVEARSDLADAQRELSRVTRLRQGGHTSEAALDNAETAVAGASARVNSAVASRKLAARDLEQTSLKAPFDGTVAHRQAEPGQRVVANQVIFELVSSRDGFDVLTHVPENLIGRISTESLQALVIPALDGLRATARVTHIGSHADSGNHYPVILRITESVPGLRSGMTAEVSFAIAADGTKTSAGAFRVPLTSLVYPVNGEPRVLRLDDTDQLASVPVTVLSVADSAALVTGDLTEGERVVARGAEFVSAGDRVSVLGQGPERFH
jgi:RND family efflux transporter MFP subunit